MNRKIFIKSIGIGTVLLSTSHLFKACKSFSAPTIKFKRSGTAARIGHLIREPFVKDKNYNYSTTTIDTLIIGAGISGLSAAYHLHINQQDNFVLLDLDAEVGGNAKSGKNQYSAYPFGAHYLPIPDGNNKPLIDFLKNNNIIESFNDHRLPIYKESYLCFSPENRLLENHFWYEGLIGKASQKEQLELNIFNKLITDYKNLKINEEFVFQIPTKNLNYTDDIIHLDNITFETFLLSNNIQSKKLHWYFNYCCLDDFGQGYNKISAFAGLHYFCSRRGVGANCDQNSILTWPEGNNKLVACLKENIKNNIQTNKLVRQVELINDMCHTYITDTINNTTELFISKHVIMATPIFIRNKILPTYQIQHTPEHQPWLVANITLKNFIDYNGYPKCWDNVIYNHPTLGYIDAQHQNINQHNEVEVYTLYKTLDFDTPANVRKIYYAKSDEDIKNEIIKDWLSIFPDSSENILEIDCNLNAHGMCSPGINYLLSESRTLANESINNKIHFAHTDYIGISIFEEAFEQGRLASLKILKNDS